MLIHSKLIHTNLVKSLFGSGKTCFLYPKHVPSSMALQIELTGQSPKLLRHASVVVMSDERGAQGGVDGVGKRQQGAAWITIGCICVAGKHIAAMSQIDLAFSTKSDETER